MTFLEDPYISVELAGGPLNTDVWTCLNPQELLGFAPQRGENMPLAGVDGLLPRPKLDTELIVDLRFVLSGNFDGNGGAAAGLAAVKRLFAVAYFRATRDANGCVVCEVVDADGVTFSGPVQVGPPVFGEGLFECDAVMSVTIPRGELQAVGS